ncbi:hypothetical protein M011DRAFT_402793 [Sporormia fimetaria CBS 119925]|uniref:Cyclin-D1-binding protein 1-like N-terminal domain-containing protein n=1 Tax=Sporormia fimetaria CBS 119925 TaxID=1340428 RepID=A0A6A6V9Y0_9PLEO|nr:hypothetical protein M011DRAFT_402793 [Sporormia fimetaria CBS 119925]
MAPNPRTAASNPPPNMETLISLTKSTQDLLSHFQGSLTASSIAAKAPRNATDTATSDAHNPLATIKATTTLLRSHTTTLSLLLLTPPLTPSAVMTKIGDVSSGTLAAMVAAATTESGPNDVLGEVMRAELRAQVRRLLSTWGDLLGLVQRFAERRKTLGSTKDTGSSESEKQEVLATTGVVWEGCDALLKVCEDGVVGLIVRKAEEWRSVLLDAVEELKEWGDDVEDDGNEDKAEGSGDEDDGFDSDDEIFGAANKLGKDDKELKQLLDKSVKRLKMVGMLYQALIKRRLKTFPKQRATGAASNGETNSDHSPDTPTHRLDILLSQLKTIPETVDDLASAFYDLDEAEANRTLSLCCQEAKSAINTAKQSWTGQDDEFTAWSAKWLEALEAS